jgi:hypothetical protein
MNFPASAATPHLDSLHACPPPRQLRPGRPVDAEWLQWIAENRLRNCTPESMLVTMSGAGVDPAEAAAAIARMETDPAYLAARKVQQLQYKLESVMANQQKLRELAPDYTRVEKRKNVTQGEFMQRYVRGSHPLVLTGVAADWPAMKRWSPQDLKARFGHLDCRSRPSAAPTRSTSRTSSTTNARSGWPSSSTR